MLTVKTKIMPSTIEGAGLGVFATNNIAKGKIVWKFNANFDRKFSKLPKHPVARNFIIKHGYKPMNDPSTYYLSADNMKFINHSTSPNVMPPSKGTPNTILIAAHDIWANDELLINYKLNYLTDDPGSQQFYN